ncbi:MAG: nitroreductase family protein [Ruminiclostridium sp.]
MIDIIEAMKQRHAVREYDGDRKIEQEKLDILNERISSINKESGLHIQLVTDEPKAFDGFMAHYGKFSGIINYIALIGKKGSELNEKCGYYGEQLVLLAAQLGLDTCWVAMSYAKVKSAYDIAKGEKLCCVISLGYGKTHGIPHKSKTAEEVAVIKEDTPKWFIDGVNAALLAPTAMNQQKFGFMLDGDKVIAKAGKGILSDVDLGIVKYHFEIGADKKLFEI